MKRILLTVLLSIAAIMGATAADPPELINYQGVLRNASDIPLDGNYDMEFHFYSAETGGDQILVDYHTLALSDQVTVNGGLFNVALGGGLVQDGSGAGTYLSISKMFGDYSQVWMRIRVGAEYLDPRVRVVASPYALNADRLGGRKTGEFINTSTTAQVKGGNFTAAELISGTGYIRFVPGGYFRGTTTYMEFVGDSSTDDIYLQAGTSANDGRIAILGDSYTELRSGNGDFLFYWGTTGTEEARLSAGGSLQLDGGLNADGDWSYFGDNTTIYSGGALTSIYNNEPTDVMRLVGGDTLTTSHISLSGSEDVEFHSNDGNFGFYVTPSLVPIAHLNQYGDLQIDGDLDVDGIDSYFGINAELYSGGIVTAFSNDTNTDWMRIVGGDDLNSTYIELQGPDALALHAYDGNFEFWNGGWDGVEIAHLDSNGDIQLDGYLDDDADIDLVNYSTITIASSPATATFAGSNMALNLGDSSADSVYVPGNLYVTMTKDFIQNHPERNDLTIHYTALEGGESGTFTRGSARLVAGTAAIQLAESFAWVTNPDLGLTAHITPRGQFSNLWVESISTEELVVRCDEPDCADAAFDYVVLGLRIGHEDYPVVQPRRVDAAVPPPGYYVSRRTDYPMRAHSPLERYSLMESEVWGAQPTREGGRAAALRDAIGLHPLEEIAPVNAGRAEPEPVELPEAGADPTVVPGVTPQPAVEARKPAPAPVAAIIPRDPSDDIDARSFRSGLPALATKVQVSEPVEPGHVLAIDIEHPAVLRIATIAADEAVFGVVTDQPGVMLESAVIGEAEEIFEAAVAVSGVTLCLVDAGFGSIRPGDLLVSSPTPGHAMRAADPLPGTVIGKALEPLDCGTGAVRMLVMMR
jgi:hypothetical protein